MNSYHYFIFDSVGRPVGAQIFFLLVQLTKESQGFFLRSVFALITHMKKGVSEQNSASRRKQEFLSMMTAFAKTCWTCESLLLINGLTATNVRVEQNLHVC